MKHVIVTGANGFVGSHTVRYLLSQGVRVTALCHNGHDQNIPSSPFVTVVPYDMNQEKSIFRYMSCDDGYDTFYHFAWSAVSGSDRGNPFRQMENVSATIKAVKFARELGCKRFVGVGSIMENETIEAVKAQGNHPSVGYVYGAAKLCAHQMAQIVAADEGIEFIWTRLTNAYGAGEYSQRMINTAVRKCLKGISPRFTAATQNYDFVYIDDVARAYYLIGENGKPFHCYLIGSSKAKPLKCFLLAMKKNVAPNLHFMFGEVPYTGINLDLSYFDCSETKKDTGFQAEIGFEEGIVRTAEWLKKAEK